MKLLLSKVNPGSVRGESKYVEYAKQFADCEATISSTNFSVSKRGTTIFECRISLFEEDGLTIVHKGQWQDGQPFRIVRPGKEIAALVKMLGNDTITIGSMYSDGYAVSFDIK